MLDQLASLRSSPGVKPMTSLGAGTVWAAIDIAAARNKPQRRRDTEIDFIFGIAPKEFL
jgi:hypothetical protein